MSEMVYTTDVASPVDVLLIPLVLLPKITNIPLRPISTQENRHRIGLESLDSFPSCIIHTARGPKKVENTSSLSSGLWITTPRKNVCACVNLTCNSIANLMRSRSERFRRLKMAVKRSDFIVRLYSQISSAKINMSF